MTEHHKPAEVDLDHLNEWTHKPPAIHSETLDLRPARGLAALLDHPSLPSLGDDLPPLWQWVYFTPNPRPSELGTDGHPLRGTFLPPVPFRRRMWASGEMQFHAPLCLGETVEKRSRVRSVELKQGSAGPLVFVTVVHEYRVANELRISETQTLVYVDTPAAGTSKDKALQPDHDSDLSRTIQADNVMLFRYSALTGNTHRIHFDRDYAVQHEGYPGLLVQAPLTATLLAGLAGELPGENLVGRRLAAFQFRARQPLVAGQPFTIHGKLDGRDTAALWALDTQGQLAMQALARLAPQ
jgi:3-methylfumaryl-CoA hydratase